MNSNHQRKTEGKPVLARLLGMLVVIGTLALGGSAQAAVLISFEPSEGFPSGDGATLAGLAVPAGIVDNWITNSLVPGRFEVDLGPGGTSTHFGDEPLPITGTQIGWYQPDANGNCELTMDLNNALPLRLVSFYYANRASGSPARLEVDYYNHSETLVGTDIFTGAWTGGNGVGRGFSSEPKFELLTVSPAFQAVDLSKVVFRTMPPNPSTGHGSFGLEDITLQLVVPEPTPIMLALAGAPWLWRRWRQRK